MSPSASLRSRAQQRVAAAGNYPRVVLLTALTGMFATTFPITLLALSISTIAEDFGAEETLIAWVISGPLLASAVALPILGKLGDLYGHRRVFLAGFSVSTGVTALTVLAWDPYSLIALRGLAVVVGAATMPTSMALINSVHAPAERARAMGWWSLVAAGSPAIGLIIGGPLIDVVGWRPIFGIQALLSIVPVVAATVVLKETVRKRDVGFDIPGSVALAAGAGGTMIALNQYPARGLDVVVAVAIAAGVLGLASFVAIERRVSHPLLQLELFGRRNFRSAMLGSLFNGGAYMGGFVLAPLMLQSVFGYSVSATALVMLIRPASFAVMSPIGGSMATRRGERPVAMFGAASVTVALVALAFGGSEHLAPLVMLGLFLQGTGNGTSNPPLTAALSNAVDETDLGVAAAGQRMMFQVGSAMGITIMTTVYGGTEQPGDFRTAYLVGAGLGAASFVFSSMLRSTRHRVVLPDAPGEHGEHGTGAGPDAGVGAGLDTHTVAATGSSA